MSRAVSLLELATELARKHERAAPERIAVIPVVVDDLEATLPALAALCKATEGRLFNTLEPELHAPVPGTTNAVRRAAIVGALTGHPTTARHVDLLDLSAGLVDAVFADPPSGTPSPGEQTVLAVARATAHSDLDEHSLAIVAYRENLIDLPFRRAVWALAVDQLNGLQHGTLRTLVFVAESGIDVRLHCQPGRGFRLAVEGNRLLRRKGMDDLQAAVARLARSDQPFVLFLGAGFSASSRLPLGNALRDSAIRQLLNISEDEPLQSANLAARFHEWLADHDWLSRAEQQMPQELFVRQLTLEQVIRAEQRIDASLPTLREFRLHHDQVIDAPGTAALDLGILLEQGVGRIVVAEVNFDMLVEKHTKAELRVFASDDEFVEAPDYLRRYLAGDVAQIPLLKLHGTIGSPETCVVSTEQTERGIGQQKLEALRTLLGAGRPRPWVYVGASMRDLDLRPLLLVEDFARGADERWVSPYLDHSVEEFGTSREGIWRSTGLRTIGDRLITETADAFFAALRRAWAAG